MLVRVRSTILKAKQKKANKKMAMFLICIHAIEFNEVVMWKYENEPLKPMHSAVDID